ncbi:pilus assembly protein PilO [Schinkia azotoformans]|uniref:pilus assembly protein PilO n=1 Tax=Schinkia azotoformans TaxID=1454 RepID=UPI002DBD1514|nr:pilus assembly protein PilO [Schinkia azotoformans]MEC1718156.1 pilus assembly protein PilO [Schinkia azotoformans]MEC1748015.1 pilus assembly protein PilO [Schinkia azotoformans]MEC1772443.1 pilus assembly protein PilO [Schinkia azotoformans]MED4368355.1 pilus assembly protein PilO [Schinkia azotoformans]MED4375068.1 pilus assembly protein PilO [Schinkia azotoformans]
MNLQLTKKNLALIFSVLFVVALVVGSYFYFLNPLKTKIKLLQDELTTEEKLYDALAQQVGDTKTGVIENSRFLQKKLPVESFLEQFLLDLEKAEVVSNSLIEDMSFQDNAVSENDVIINDSKEDQADGQENEAANVNESEEIGQQASSVPSMPEGIKRVTVNLTVTSANFFDMIKFLETIEHLERITKIDSLSFTGGKEILSVDDELEELTYTVVISTFYYPALEELKGELPVFDAPPPSNKDNPLPTGMYYKDDQTKSAQVDEKSNSATTNTAGTSKDNTKSSEEQSENKSNLEPTEKSQSIKQRAVMSGNSTE